MVGGLTWISFPHRHYFDLSRYPPQRKSPEMSGSKCRPLLQHTLKLEKKIVQYIFQISTWKVFFIENIFIMKSLNDFRKMVETSVDLSSTFKADTSTA